MSDTTEQTFKLFTYLPNELQMMVVDEMKPDDRCRFSGTSKKCSKKAKSSKNYIYELDFRLFERDGQLTIKYGVDEDFRDDFDQGFQLDFVAKGGRKYVRCVNLSQRELWRIPLDKSIDIIQYAIQHLKNLLEVYQNSLRSLAINAKNSTIEKINIGSEIRCFNRLERLGLFAGVEVRNFILKTRKPLKWFYVIGQMSDEVIPKCEKVYQHLHLPFTKFTKEQFLRLSASRVFMNIGDQTEQDIFEFIKSWQDGTVGKEIQRYDWALHGSKFDVEKVSRFFGVRFEGDGSQYHEIMQNGRDGMKAVLMYNVLPCVFSFVNMSVQQ